MRFTLSFRKLLGQVESVSIRTRLAVLFVLFGIAVAVNILALFFLARSVSSSVQVTESVRVRQLAAVEMHEELRNAEAALYRYHLEGEVGFATQFDDQMAHFGASVAVYQSLASTPDEHRWAIALGQTWQNASTLGKDLIRLHDKQTSDLKVMLDTDAQLSDILMRPVGPSHKIDSNFQQAINGMSEDARGMLVAVTSYIAAPDDRTRGQFTEATIRFQQHANQYHTLATEADELESAKQIDALFPAFQNVGSQLISGRDQEQALYARFFAEIFQAGQVVIVGQIQPLEARKLADAQHDLWTAVGSAIAISLIVPFTMTLLAGLMGVRLARGMNQNILALLRGADRVAAGNLDQPVRVTTHDELERLAEAFNKMMADLATRELRLKARLAELETLRQVSLDITSTLDLDHVLNTIATSVLDLVEASSVHIFTCDDHTGPLRLAASAGPAGAPTTRAPLPDSLVAAVASTGRTQIVSAVLDEPLSSAAFPMKLGDQVLGVLHILSDARRTFTSEDVRILNLLTDQAAVALGNARLYKSLSEREERVRALMQKMAQIQDEERRLIGLDLHDGLAQLVISANMRLQAFNSMMAQTMDAPARQELEESRKLIQSAIDEARRVIIELRPTVVEELGLAEGLHQYVNDVCAAEGWRSEIQIHLDGIELSSPAETAIFRIAQEALSNARKHSHTQTIKVVLRREEGDLLLCVQDFGRGFDFAALSDENERVGLTSMRERARMLGGRCEISSEPGQGTSVGVRVPLSALRRSVHEQ